MPLSSILDTQNVNKLVVRTGLKTGTYTNIDGILKDSNNNTITEQELSGATFVPFTAPELTTITTGIFSGVEGIVEIVLSNTAIEISNNAFEDCSGLVCIVVPKSVTVIGDNVFKNCGALEKVVVLNPSTTIGTGITNNSPNAVVYYIDREGENTSNEMYINSTSTNTGITLTNLNFEGLELTNSNLKNIDFTGANLTGANLTGSNLENVTLPTGDKITKQNIRTLFTSASATQFFKLDKTTLGLPSSDKAVYKVYKHTQTIVNPDFTQEGLYVDISNDGEGITITLEGETKTITKTANGFEELYFDNDNTEYKNDLTLVTDPDGDYYEVFGYKWYQGSFHGSGSAAPPSTILFVDKLKTQDRDELNAQLKNSIHVINAYNGTSQYSASTLASLSSDFDKLKRIGFLFHNTGSNTNPIYRNPAQSTLADISAIDIDISNETAEINTYNIQYDSNLSQILVELSNNNTAGRDALVNENKQLDISINACNERINNLNSQKNALLNPSIDSSFNVLSKNIYDILAEWNTANNGKTLDVDIITCNFELANGLLDSYNKFKSEVSTNLLGNTIRINYTHNVVGTTSLVDNWDLYIDGSSNNTKTNLKQKYFKNSNSPNIILTSNRVNVLGVNSDVLVIDQSFIDVTLATGNYDFSGSTIEISGTVVFDNEYIDSQVANTVGISVTGLSGSSIIVNSTNPWNGLVRSAVEKSITIDNIDMSFATSGYLSNTGGGLIFQNIGVSSPGTGISNEITIQNCSVAIGDCIDWHLISTFMACGGLLGAFVGDGYDNLRLNISDTSVTFGNINTDNLFEGGLLVGYLTFFGKVSGYLDMSFNNVDVVCGNVTLPNNVSYGVIGVSVGESSGDCSIYINNCNITQGNIESINNNILGGGLLGFAVHNNSTDSMNIVVTDSNFTIGDVSCPFSNYYSSIIGPFRFNTQSSVSILVSGCSFINGNITSNNDRLYGGIIVSNNSLTNSGSNYTLNANNNTIVYGDMTCASSMRFGGIIGSNSITSSINCDVNINNNSLTFGDCISTGSQTQFGGITGAFALNTIPDGGSINISSNTLVFSDITANGKVSFHGGIVGVNNFGNTNGTNRTLDIISNTVTINESIASSDAFGGIMSAFSGGNMVTNLNSNVVNIGTSTSSSSSYFGGIIGYGTFSAYTQTQDINILNNTINIGTITSSDSNYFGGITGLSCIEYNDNNTINVNGNSVTISSITSNVGGGNYFGGIIGKNCIDISCNNTVLNLIGNTFTVTGAIIGSPNYFGGMLGEEFGYNVAPNSLTVNIDNCKTFIPAAAYGSDYGYIAGGYTGTIPVINYNMVNTYTAGTNYFTGQTNGPFDGLFLAPPSQNRLPFFLFPNTFARGRYTDILYKTRVPDVSGNLISRQHYNSRTHNNEAGQRLLKLKMKTIKSKYQK